MMTRRVKIRVQPNESVRFPGVCVHCANPATERFVVGKRQGLTRREIEVPLCEACATAVGRQSGDEERLTKARHLLMGVVGVAFLLLLLLLLPANWALWLRLAIGVGVGLAAAVVVRQLVQPAIDKAATPQKQGVRQSIRMDRFSWRATTFTFANEAFSERFEELNSTLLMEI